MRHAHETLKTLLLLSGVSNPQGSSFSSHYSKRKENGKPEAYHIIRRSSSAADHPVNTGAGTESKSPMRKRRTKYPLRRLPGAPWSMSKTVGNLDAKKNKREIAVLTIRVPLFLQSMQAVYNYVVLDEGRS